MYKDFMNDNLDSEPLYNEIEHIIAQVYDTTDPLPQVANESLIRINWHDVLNNTKELLLKGKDIRVIIWYMRANLHINGISSLYGTFKILEDILIYDVEEKANLTDVDKQILSEFATSLGWLANVQCINEIKNSFLSPSVKITVRSILDIDILKSNNFLTYPELISSIDKANFYFKVEKKIPVLKDQLATSINLLKSIEDFVNEYSDGYMLDCKLLIQLLQKFLNKIKSFDELSLEIDTSLEFQGNLGINKMTTIQSADTKASSLSDVRNSSTRSEVVLLLDNVLQYFQVHEPSHPAPILIKRAQKMIGMDFESIIKELLPESIEALRLYTGIIKEEENDN